MRQINWKKLFLSIGISLGTGFLASFLIRGSMDIYSQFKRPVLAPNGWVFPIVWTVLYVLMGVTAYLVYTSETSAEEKEKALSIYGFQLFFNFLWSIIFFTFKNFLLAFGVLLLLWGFIIAMMINFNKINRTAGWLQLPYLIWVPLQGT